MSVIDTLKYRTSNNEEVSLYPRTLLKCVTDEDGNTVEDIVNTATAIAKGRNQALSYASYSDMITALSTMDSEELKKGQNIYIGTVGVPDLWIYSVEENSVTYNYVDDTTLEESLIEDNTVQIGYYKISQLEGQKVDLTNYYTKTESDAITTPISNKLGNTNINTIGDGTVTGAINNINDNVNTINSNLLCSTLLSKAISDGNTMITLALPKTIDTKTKAQNVIKAIRGDTGSVYVFTSFGIFTVTTHYNYIQCFINSDVRANLTENKCYQIFND